MKIDSKEKRRLLSILILELVILVGLSVLMVSRDKKRYIFNSEDLVSNSTTYVRLKPGSYNITMSYYPKSIDPNLENGPWHIKEGSMNYVPSGLCGQLDGYLDFDTTEITIPIWLYHSTDEFWIDNECPVQMQSISITETNAMFKENLLYLLVAFSIVDLFVFRFIKSKDGDRKEIEVNKAIGAILATTLVVSLPLMINYIIDGHDIYFHLTRIEGVKIGLLNKQIPVRINRYALEGQGYADPIFYPQLFLYIPAFLRILGIPVYRSYQLFICFLNLLGCIISFVSFYQITHNNKVSILGMVIYNMAPYHLACTYSRAAVGEAQAYLFLPLIGAGCFLLLSKETNKDILKNGIVSLCLGFTGIIQSHILSCEMTGIFVILLIIICVKRAFRIKTIISFVIAGLLTVGLNAWFLIPFLQSYGMDIYAYKDITVYLQEYGLVPYQLLGARSQLSGLAIFDSESISNEMGISLGLSIVVGIAIVLFGIRRVLKQWTSDYSKGIMVTGLLGMISAWITTSMFPWKYVESLPIIGNLLKVVQFPWRYLGICTVCFTFAIVFYMLLLEEEIVDLPKEERDDDKILNSTKGYKEFLGLQFSYFALIAAAVILCVLNIEDIVASDTSMFRPYDDLAKGRAISQAEFLFTDTTIYTIGGAKHVDTPYYTDKDALIFQVNNEQGNSSKVDTPLTYYPYYIATDVNTKTMFNVAKNTSGTLYFEVPEGYSGDVKVFVKEKTSWIIGDVLSIVTLILMLAYLTSCSRIGMRFRKTQKSDKKEEVA